MVQIRMATVTQVPSKIIKSSDPRRSMIRSFSYGGGVQSTAALVLAAQGQIDYPLFLFANVGHDAENPASIAYVEEVAHPYAAANGIELVEVQRTMRDGSKDTLMARIDRGQKTIPIPMRMANGAPGTRTCTSDYKIAVIAKELKRRGATEAEPAITALGISVDEYHRARTSSGIAWQLLEYPLIDMRITRANCLTIIARAGLPEPEPSSCYFCPFQTLEHWKRLKRHKPELFQKAVELEERMNERRRRLGKDEMWMTYHARPLAEVVGDADLQMEFDMPGGCASGYCLT